MEQVMITRRPPPLLAENSWGIIFFGISGNNYLFHYLSNIFGNLICNSFGAHSNFCHCFGCGSDAVRMRFGCCSVGVRMWFGRGSDVVRLWFGCGSVVGRTYFRIWCRQSGESQGKVASSNQKTFPGRVRVQFAQIEGHKKATKNVQMLFFQADEGHGKVTSKNVTSKEESSEKTF